jgi:hypothetical protein
VRFGIKLHLEIRPCAVTNIRRAGMSSENTLERIAEQDRDPAVRINAIRQLSRIRSKNALERIAGQDRDANVRVEAVRVLGGGNLLPEPPVYGRYCYFCGIVPGSVASKCPTGPGGQHSLQKMDAPMYCYYCAQTPGKATRCPVTSNERHSFQRM